MRHTQAAPLPASPAMPPGPRHSVTVASSDDELLAAMEAAPGILSMTRAAALVAYHHARGLDAAPWRLIDGWWMDFRRAALSADAQCAAATAPNNAVDRAGRAAQLRAALAIRDKLSAFASRFEPLSYQDRCRETAAIDNRLDHGGAV